MSESTLYYSTNLKAAPVSFKEALLRGLAPDGGLYMPRNIPMISASTIEAFSSMSYHEVAFNIFKEFLTDQIDNDELLRITREAYNFDVPLEQVYERKYVLRLDCGPTASFKDFAGRMMGRLMHHYLSQGHRQLLILTATSGDTGSAIANAFYGLENIKVIVLFPEHEVTSRQRKQMTTLGKNIEIIAINGTFDDCQALVKQAFTDPDLALHHLSSANSINIGRLLPQIVYYFYSFAKLAHNVRNESVVFSVPSGNFGDFMGGLLAKTMGLPVKKFIVATNENDEVPLYLKTGVYHTVAPSKNCISSAMNVGHPSNFSRVIALYGGIMDEKGTITKAPDLARMRNDLFGVSITDIETKTTIKQAYKKYQLLLEPHGAVGWTGLQHYLKNTNDKNNHDQLFVSLETAHPAKFPEHIREILGLDPPLPPSMYGLEEKKESYINMHNDYGELKAHLKNNYSNEPTQ